MAREFPGDSEVPRDSWSGFRGAFVVGFPLGGPRRGGHPYPLPPLGLGGPGRGPACQAPSGAVLSGYPGLPWLGLGLGAWFRLALASAWLLMTYCGLHVFTVFRSFIL